MSNIVRITVEDIDTKMLLYTKIELERATSAGGTFAEITELTLVADDYFYEYTDATGTLTSWYRYRFSNTAETVRSDYTNPFQQGLASRLRIRQEFLNTYDAGMVFDTDNAGTATTVRTADSRVKSSVYMTDRGKGQWLMPVSGARAGEQRRVVSSVPATAEFTISPAMSGALGVGDQVEWHWLADPTITNNAINRALARTYTVDRVPIIGVVDQNEYDLSYLAWLVDRKQITGLFWYPDASEIDETPEGVEYPWQGNGHWYNVREDQGAIKLLISPTITATEVLYLEATRPADPVHTDSSVIPANVPLPLVVGLTYDEVLATLTRPGHGSAIDRVAWAQARLEHAATDLATLIRNHRPRPRYAMPTSGSPIVVPQPFKAR